MSGRSFFGHSLSASFLFISLAFLSTPSQAMETEIFSGDNQEIKHVSVKEQSVSYTQDDENTVRFFYNNPKPEGELDSAQLFYSYMFPKGVLFFNGKIDLQEFIEALAATLKQFNVLFGRFHNNKGLSIQHNSEYFVQLEIGQSKDDINTTNLNSLLPQKIDKKIQTGVIDSVDGLPHLEGLPLAGFKLTHSTDGKDQFAIGYFFNHILDQSSIVYFFKYLSSVYTNGENKTSLKPPVPLYLSPFREAPVTSITSVNVAPLGEDVLKGLRLEGETEGFQYVPEKKAIYPLFSERGAYPTVDLQFKKEAIRKFIEDNLKSKNDNFPSQNDFISKNDVIEALLWKIYSFDPKLTEDFSFAFACNMRPRLALGDEVIGNALVSGHIPLKIEDVKTQDIFQLAKLSRLYVNKIDAKTFTRRLAWYDKIKKSKENPQNYMADTFVKRWPRRVSNWTSFSYSNIKFNRSAPEALKTLSYAPFGINIICFENTTEGETFTTSVKIPEVCLPAVKELQEKTRLFTYSVQK